jgi:beta-galactosidase
MEMWCGWFDAWGDEKHHCTSAEKYAEVVEDMLKKGSLNMYMFIGGTNFGFTSGANHCEKFAPDVTSYDYDALLSECGLAKSWKRYSRFSREHGQEVQGFQESGRSVG